MSLPLAKVYLIWWGSAAATNAAYSAAPSTTPALRAAARLNTRSVSWSLHKIVTRAADFSACSERVATCSAAIRRPALSWLGHDVVLARAAASLSLPTVMNRSRTLFATVSTVSVTSGCFIGPFNPVDREPSISRKDHSCKLTRASSRPSVAASPGRRAALRIFQPLPSSPREGFAYYEWRRDFDDLELDFALWIHPLGRGALQLPMAMGAMSSRLRPPLPRPLASSAASRIRTPRSVPCVSNGRLVSDATAGVSPAASIVQGAAPIYHACHACGHLGSIRYTEEERRARRRQDEDVTACIECGAHQTSDGDFCDACVQTPAPSASPDVYDMIDLLPVGDPVAFTGVLKKMLLGKMLLEGIERSERRHIWECTRRGGLDCDRRNEELVALAA